MSLEASKTIRQMELSVRNKLWRTLNEGLPEVSIRRARCFGGRKFSMQEPNSSFILLMRCSGIGEVNNGGTGEERGDLEAVWVGDLSS